MLRYLLGNGLWTLANAPAWTRWQAARRDPRRAQLARLRRYLVAHADTEFGRAHRYATIRTVEQFRDAVPVRSHDELAPWIERIRQGVPNVLTAEPVIMMEKTSGSGGAAKYIPYTAALRCEFQAAVGAWMFDLFVRRPALLAGAQYWSISPAARAREVTPGGIPVGFEDDTEYLAPFERHVVNAVMAVPGSLCRVPDLEENRRLTLEHLARCPDLRFISVWNPSFLTLLVRRLPAGTAPLDLWPRLRLISCWTSAVSARFLPELRALFPGVEIQGKGLLATEGVVTFPRVGAPAPAPALTSHFLEFLDEDGRARLVDELDVGGRYAVVITTGGGLARYALGDHVEVVAPGALEFVGRSAQVSDLCGEKLSEAFVGPALEAASARYGLGGFAMLAPEWSSPPRYLLFVEAEDPAGPAAFVEGLLRASVHYDHCRRLGQLGPVEGVRVVEGAERYLRGCERLGQRAGNVKPAYLRREFDWRTHLETPHVA